MIHIIFNPNSGSKGEKFKNKIIDELKLITNSILHITEYSNHASELALASIANKAEKIIVIGGDGTINEVASQLVKQSIPLGIIPMGSGNGFARHLKIPMEFQKALQKCLKGQIIEIDVAYFNDRPFFCTAGIGFDAVVAHQFAKSSKRGFLNYIKSTLQSILSYKTTELYDHSSHKKFVFSLSFANANQFGNNAYISPNSNLQDGLFEIIEIKPMNLLKLSELGIRLFLKSLPKHNKVSINSQSEFIFKAKVGTPIHLDGENLFINQGENKITILANALKVIV